MASLTRTGTETHPAPYPRHDPVNGYSNLTHQDDRCPDPCECRGTGRLNVWLLALDDPDGCPHPTEGVGNASMPRCTAGHLRRVVGDKDTVKPILVVDP